MDFLKALISDQEIITDQEVQEIMDNIDLDQLDEDALDRIEQRVKQREIAMYSLLVGKQNALKAKLFVDRAEKGQPIPNNIVQGYYPAVDMIHEIVKAGPGYISLLKNLHQRAKKASK